MGNAFACCNASQDSRQQKFTDVRSAVSNYEDQDVPKGARTCPVPPTPSKTRVRALYTFQGVNRDDLAFEKGDLMEIDEDTLPETVEWVLAVLLKTKKSGYIPSNYVVNDDSSPQTHEGWFSRDKKEAQKGLLQPGIVKGTFLIRRSADEQSYALSVRDFDKKTGESCVKHFRLYSLDNGAGYYISPKRTFSTFYDLIEYYKENADFCCLLTSPFNVKPPVVPFRQLEINRDNVRLLTKIGAGFFADVWKGIYLKVVDVAIKTLKNGTMSPEEFLNEAKIMHKLRHQKLVQILGVVSCEEPFYIISELMVNGDLLTFLRSENGRLLKFDTLIDMHSQVADGMTYLENANFIHRDLRAANVLVGQSFGNSYEVKVADFGLARILQDETYISNPQSKYPIKWSAPEAVSERKFSIKSDVWSFGILMYEIITFGRTPYAGMGNADVTRKVFGGYRMAKPENDSFPVPDSYYNMMCKCWNRNPVQRPTFASLYAFFDNYFVSSEPEYKEMYLP